MSEKILRFDKTLKKFEYLFRWSGMNLESQKKNRSENLKCTSLFFFNFLLMNSDLAGAICWFIQGASKGESFTSLTYVAPCITISFLCNLKTLFFFIYDNQANELITSLKSLEEKYELEKDDEKVKIMEADTDLLNLIIKVFNFFNWAVMFAFPLMPLTIIALKYMKDNEIELQLPLLVVYPFDAFDIRVWPFVYVRQIWSVLIVIIQIAGIDFLFYTCCMHIRIQYRCLQHDIENLIPATKYLKRNLSRDKEFHHKVVNLIKWHKEIMRCVNLLELINSKATLYNFVSSSFLICLTGFNVTTSDDVAFMVSFLSFLFMSLLQIFFLCLFGDMLTQASMDVSNAAYNSRWYMGDASTARILYLVLIRAQNPCKLTAYGFADVNLRAFAKILSTAWSYFALLRRVYSSPRT